MSGERPHRQRRDRAPHRLRGFAVLLTGLPGAGKSTTVAALAAMLRERGPRPVTVLDGDAVRLGLSAGLGFSRADREAHLGRVGRAAADAVRGGGIALCAVIAPYEASRRALRETVEAAGGVAEVYIATPLATCEARDARGLYARARRGLVECFTGIDDPYEPPASPDAEIDTTDIPPERAARLVLAALERRGLVRRSALMPRPGRDGGGAR